MSIEKDLSRIATALEALVGIMSEKSVTKTVQNTPVVETVQAASPAVAAVYAPPVAAPTPVVVTAPVVAEVPKPAAAPTPVPVQVEAPATPTAVSPSGSARFTDAKAVVTYAMEKYKSLGPAKGAGIQQVLLGIGCKSINDVKPEQYEQFYSGVEAL